MTLRNCVFHNYHYYINMMKRTCTQTVALCGWEIFSELQMWSGHPHVLWFRYYDEFHNV